ncbi:uncharacterized protein LOC110441698 [Mizuhopecten yessoensis]|uniref:uncharacterized protein LOC110441698 n=1 Tax=Mizuhopecten yessoensis TaxID=6573 RepID=UPI000B45AB5F|nr:uncharacterized protein LOC110441698 [Mizuhopecten yessoensis]
MSGDEIVPLLPEVNIEPANNVCQQRTIRPQRSLPPGKTYHIFISYSSHDESYVLRLKNVLEGLGFKCMLAEHDFSYGVSVMRNIETTIQTCHKLLLVVSQHFLQSAMCDKEVDMAHKYAADIGRNDFMIVLRLDESKMPLKLDYMTYINGAELEVKDVGRKVEKAFDGFADVPLPPNINGQEIIRCQPTETSHRLWCSSSYEFGDLSQYERNMLLAWSVEESQTCYREIVEDANDHFLLKRYAVFAFDRKSLCFWVLLALGIVTLSASLYFLITKLNGTDTFLNDLLIIFICSISFTTGLYTGCTVYLFHQMMRRLYSIVRKNTDCKSQNYIVIPRQHRNALFISFIYYDMKRCWNYLKQRARENWPDDSEEDIANKCNEELVTTILGSFKGSDWNPIPQAASIRHNTYQNRCCLCMVAKSSWTYRKSALNVTLDQGIENNQDEETCVMKIAESETEHETFVKNTFEIDHEHFESTEENDETSVKKIVCNRQESNSSDSHVAGAVSGSPRTEAGSGFLLTGAEFGKSSLRGAKGDTSLRGAECGTSLRGAEGDTSLRRAEGGTSLRRAEGDTSLRRAECGTSLRGAEGDTSLRRAEGGTSLRRAEGDTSLRSAEGGTSLRSAEGDTSLRSAEGGTSLRSAEGDTSLRSAEGGTSLRRAKGDTSLRGAEGGTSLRSAEGDTSLRSAEGGTSLRRA